MRIHTRPPRVQHRHPRARDHLRLVPVNRAGGLLARLEQLAEQRRDVCDAVVGGLAPDLGLVSWVFWEGRGETDGDVATGEQQGERKLTHGHGMRCVADQRYPPTSIIPQSLVRRPILEIDGLCLCPLRNILHDATKRFYPATRQFLHPLHPLLIVLRDLSRRFSSAEPRTIGPAREDLAADVFISNWNLEEREPEEGVGGGIARLEEEGVEVAYLLASRLGIWDGEAEKAHGEAVVLEAGGADGLPDVGARPIGTDEEGSCRCGPVLEFRGDCSLVVLVDSKKLFRPLSQVVSRSVSDST